MNKPKPDHPWRRERRPPPPVKQPNCSFCDGKLLAQTPVEKHITFRCDKCNVRVVVTNASYLFDKNPHLVRYYRYLVAEEKLTKQEWLTD